MPCCTGCTLPKEDPTGSTKSSTTRALAVGGTATNVYTCSAGYSGTVTLTCPVAGKEVTMQGGCKRGEW